MKRRMIWCVGGLTWMAGLEGALQLQRLPTAAFGEHGVCGPWGCGPPAPALLACHGFWLVLLCPPAVVAAFSLSRKWVWRIGLGLVGLGLCGLVAVAGWEAATWLPQVSAFQRRYAGERLFFALVTLVDVPILQCLAIGAGFCLAARARIRAAPGRSPELAHQTNSITESGPKRFGSSG